MASRRTGALLVAVVAIALYANTLDNDFVYDDRTQILQNRLIQETGNVPKLLVTSVWDFRSTPAKRHASNYYRPVFTLTLAAVHAAAGLEAVAYHAFCVSLHALVSVLVFLLAIRLLGEGNGSFALLAGLLFAAHPAHVESVAWISGLPDPLAAAFALVAVALLRRRRGVGGAAAVAAAAGGAFFSKETGVALLAVLAVHEVLWPSRAGRRATWTFLAVVLAVYLALRLVALGGLAVETKYAELSLLSIFLSVPALVLDYVVMAFLPHGFNAFHVFRPVTSPLDPRFLASVGLLAALAVAVARWIRQGERVPVFAVSWLFAFLIPVLAIRSVGINVFADRYLYLPTVASCVLLAWAGARLAGRRRTAAAALLLAPCVFWSFQTVARNEVWRDEETLALDTLAKSPDARFMHCNLGVWYLDTGRPFAAIAELRKAGDDPALRGCAELNLAITRHTLYDYTRARDHYLAYLRTDPFDLKAIANLAHVESELGRPRSALALYRRVLELDPDYPALHFNLGYVYRDLGDFERSIAELRIALERGEVSRDAVLVQLGVTRARQGKAELAAELYRQALAENPSNRVARSLAADPARDSLARRIEARQMAEAAARFARDGRYALALRVLGHAAARAPDDALPHQYRANVHVLQNQPRKAADALREALRRDPGNPLYRQNLEALTGGGEPPPDTPG